MNLVNKKTPAKFIQMAKKRTLPVFLIPERLMVRFQRACQNGNGQLDVYFCPPSSRKGSTPQVMRKMVCVVCEDIRVLGERLKKAEIEFMTGLIIPKPYTNKGKMIFYSEVGIVIPGGQFWKAEFCQTYLRWRVTGFDWSGKRPHCWTAVFDCWEEIWESARCKLTAVVSSKMKIN